MSRHSEQRLEADPDACEETCAADILARYQRNDLRRSIAGRNDQLSDFLTLGDRSDQRSVVADFGLDRAARKSGWHGHRKVAGRNEGDRAGAAHLNLCGADLCSLLKQWLGLPRVEA